MQDNEPLMKALSKLINSNNPDLTLFVGEALVGNDAVDQLKKFNERLTDLSLEAREGGRSIDGILLTKFDTIDDKVLIPVAAFSCVCLCARARIRVSSCDDALRNSCRSALPFPWFTPRELRSCL